ncbi:hypothetical protein A1O3_04855 [Capronia epimyces CBS 606.96]|uniref:Uncharacterized protein n=1 Tax=Capronia epimyces CBS 606.96 TaxID=1182542 RepID=W9XVC5_9EURO|nr:uncharacterized protein A1O3_04855 [Capronia epimyces CBS 606.96]EXJ84188.1 hypothetical protein A1O3_04855 [Capronia epimyces CBS 606.96]
MTASRRQSNAQSNRLQVSNPFQYYPPDYAEPPESTLQARGIQEHDNVSDHFTHEYHVSQQAAWAYNPAEDTSAWPASQVPNNLPGLTINQPAVQPYGYNKHHPEFHEHGSNLHADQYYKQEDVVSWNPETRPGVVVNARGGQTRDTLGQLEDDLAMLDFPEPLSRNGAARFFPIQQRTQALGATMELAELMDAEPLCVTSQFFRDHSETAYLKHISQTPDREVFSSDPAFADIAESGPVTSFKDLYLRKEALKLSFESDDFASSDFRHVQQPSTCAGQKHRYQPCSKQTKDHAPPSIDQDERLASQRVTDTPEPIALSGSFGAAPMKQRQEPNDQPYYQPRDQQWLPSQATNQQQPHHDNGAYSATDIHDAQQLRSPHAQRGRPPYTDNGHGQKRSAEAMQ